MHLEAADDLLFTVPGRTIRMLRGETFYTENSHKYTPDQARLLLQAGGPKAPLQSSEAKLSAC